MAADPIIYCLERVTDFREFERFCAAFLAGLGYSAIDPLGGTGDKGRDAVIWPSKSGEKVVFAFTVRADWDKKLVSDSQRIKEMDHEPESLVFVCTESLSATNKDWAQSLAKNDYGWNLDLFDLERMRAQLAGPLRHLIAQHPAIFTPPIFPRRGGLSIAESRDTILIDHVDSDRALASWLNRRLSADGFRTWCNGIAPLAGENADDSIRQLLDTRAVQYLPIFSAASVQDEMFLERCTLAGAKNGLALPCMEDIALKGAIPSRLANIAPADFSRSWATGLGQVVGRFLDLGIERALSPERGRQIALRDYIPSRVTTTTPEKVFANVFQLAIPQTMLVYDLRQGLSNADLAFLRSNWAFVQVNATRLVAFSPPPSATRQVPDSQTTEFVWTADPFRDGKRTVDTAKELARRSLELAMARAGLEYCEDRRVFYFPRRDGLEWVQHIHHVDGRKTTVNLTGKRTKGFGERASPFLYHLAPKLFPHRDASGAWSASLSIYVRTTDMQGNVFEGKEIGRRRKIVGKSWWNQQWLARLLGVIQGLQTSEGRIEVGVGRHAVVLSTAPMEWECPVGLDVLALSGAIDIGEELAEMRDITIEDEDDPLETPQVQNASIAPRGIA